MKSDGNGWPLDWRRFSVDVLIGAATLVIAFAAIGTTAEALYMTLIPGALVGIGLMLEPDVTAEPAGEVGPHPLRLTMEPHTARPARLAVARFDAATRDATSGL